MKKVFKYLGIFVAILVVTVGVLNIISSDEKEIAIVIKQEVNAPASAVYDKVRNLKNYPSWSPFRLTDPEQKYSLSNTDGEVGARFHWIGVKEVSEGYQEIVALENNKAVKIKCNITVPYEAKPEFNYFFTEKDNKTYITQEFKVQMPFPANIIAHFTGLRKDMKATNEKGLSLLKKVCEENLAQL
jgi:ribosome-associated toxin RatA of RatAB toxin-antitoxin module